MNELFNGLEYERTYINFEDHLNKVKIVLNKQKAAGFKINADKLFFAAKNILLFK